METAIGSFVAGKSLAKRIHKIVNPVLAAETTAMNKRAEEGVYMNHQLPDFERRYLPDLQLGEQGEKDYGEVIPMGRLDALESWRASVSLAHSRSQSLREISLILRQLYRPKKRDVFVTHN